MPRDESEAPPGRVFQNQERHLENCPFRTQTIALRHAAEAQLKQRYAEIGDKELQIFKGQIANLKGHERKARVFLGWLYYSLGRMEEAAGELQAVIALDPDSPNQHLNLAHLYVKDGKPEKARAELKKYLKKNQVGELDTKMYTKMWIELEKKGRQP